MFNTAGAKDVRDEAGEVRSVTEGLSYQVGGVTISQSVMKPWKAFSVGKLKQMCVGKVTLTAKYKRR